MNSKNLILVALILFTSVVCKDKPGHRLGEMADDPDVTAVNKTKFAKVGDLHVAFDLMSMVYHERMMKLMKAPMKHIPGATHGMMVTVMDYKTKRIIEHATVKLKVIYPDGETRSFATEVMRGAGMLHHAIHLDASQSGKYQFLAKIASKGNTLQTKAIFNL